VGEEDSTAAGAEDFMEAVEEGFTGVEVSTGEGALRLMADVPTADFAEATTEGGATTEGAAVMAGAGEVTAGATAGAEDIGAEDTVTDGVGDLALGGRIGVGDGDIRMATTTARGIMGPTLIILTRTTVLRTIPRAIRILTTGTTIPHRQIPTRGPGPTRTDPQNPGDHRCQKAHPTRTRATQTLRSGPLRQVGQFSPLTG
jgi:hypothetical protein